MPPERPTLQFPASGRPLSILQAKPGIKYYPSSMARCTAPDIVFTRAIATVDTSGMTINSERLEMLTRMLDVSTMRQDVIAQNIANVNTPGYRTLEVAFDEALQAAMASSSGGVTHAPAPQIVEGAGGLERPDRNNVDIDLELARLQKNAIYFKVYAQIIANDLAQQRSAISGR